MILPTMTYEEIARAIEKDMPKAMEAIRIAIPQFSKLAKKCKRFPYIKTTTWEHPDSRNKYVIALRIDRKAEWDKPSPMIFCKYNTTYGEHIIMPSFSTYDASILYNIFIPHFFDRYAERGLEECEEITQQNIILSYLFRNNQSMHMGADLVSEKEKDDPNFRNETLMVLDGLCMCKIPNGVDNLIIFKTFIPHEMLYDNQNQSVYKEYLNFLYIRALQDNTKYKRAIDEFYYNAIAEYNKIVTDQSLPEDEKWKKAVKYYEDTVNYMIEHFIYT